MSLDLYPNDEGEFTIPGKHVMQILVTGFSYICVAFLRKHHFTNGSDNHQFGVVCQPYY